MKNSIFWDAMPRIAVITKDVSEEHIASILSQKPVRSRQQERLLFSILKMEMTCSSEPSAVSSDYVALYIRKRSCMSETCGSFTNRSSTCGSKQDIFKRMPFLGCDAL
jgi:hypothetical protein